jgi:ribonuclease Z
MSFSLTILGANSAIPIGSRFPTSQVLEFNQHAYMIDCGEGTQIQVRKNKIKIQRIKSIFISHLHGDHYFGIFGLLGTMSLLGRQMPLKIYSMPGLREMVELQLKVSHNSYDFEIEFIELTHGTSEKIYEDSMVEVYTIPLAHRIPTNGFLFKQKEGHRKLEKSAIEEYKIPVAKMAEIKEGADFVTENGEIIPNESITSEPNKVWTYAYCSDTKYTERILPYIQNVDVLYHEATFLEAEIDRAKSTMHSTAKQAAKIAQMANVGELIIGHYSARYKELFAHEKEAKTMFQNVKLAIEGRIFDYS